MVVRNAPSRILIVRPSALGDVARTVPVLVSLKRKWPEAKIDWLVNDVFADAVRAHPDLHAVVEFRRKGFSKFLRNWGTTKAVMQWLGELKRAGYDRVYDLQGLGRSGLFAWWTRAKKRIGPADARELAWLAYHDRVKISDDVVHTVDRMLGITEYDGVETVKDMRLYCSAEQDAWFEVEAERYGLVAGEYAVFAPTAAWLSKRWPIVKFVEIAKRLVGVGIKKLVVVGGPGEEEQTRGLVGSEIGGLEIVDMTGKTRVGEMMRVIGGAGLVLCNDSAAAHIAVGFGRRMVCIFGPTDPAKVSPYGYDEYVVCPPVASQMNYRDRKLDQSVIAEVGVEEVWEAIEKALGSEAPCPIGEHCEK